MSLERRNSSNFSVVLVEHEKSSEDFLETPAFELAAKTMIRVEIDSGDADLIGKTVSHYRVLRKLGGWGWARAIEEEQKALELDPNLASAHEMLAHIFSSLGKHEEALAEARQANQLDPFSEYLALTLLRARRYEESIQEAKRILEAGPGGCV